MRHLVGVALVLLCTLPALGACSDSAVGGDDAGGIEINFGPKDQGSQPGKDVPTSYEEVDDEAELSEDIVEKEQVAPIGVCGDGVCSGAENSMNCAKDCQEATETAAFVFAHKGDELGSLGRIYDLTQAGNEVYVFFLTFDDTPIEELYSDSASKLSVAFLGVPVENIYAYEKYIDWDIVSGNHEVVDRLTQHFVMVEPDSIYVPQLCGSELEDELAHVVGVWSAKKAHAFPTYYEVPTRSNYYVQGDPDSAFASSDPDMFMQHFIKRWKLIPKSTEELKPTLAAQDMAQIRMAAAHIMNPWLQEFIYKLPEDKVLFLLRDIQKYRELPQGQQTDGKPFVDSVDNPGAKYIYQEQGYTHDEFKKMAHVIESFYGSNLRTDPSALPWYDEPESLIIMHDFDVTLQVRSFSLEPDEFNFIIGFGAAKEETDDCAKPEPVALEAMGSTEIVVPCKAKEPIGEHTYYFRAYSKLAQENNDPALHTEVPFRVKIGNK